jgi:hypothetical protein
MSQSELAHIAFHALLTELERTTPSENGTEYMLETSLVLRDSTAVRKKDAITPESKRQK